MSSVRVGTAGWHYPTGRGTWNGVFYPPVKSRQRDFDELAFYSEHFDTVEINATFYGQPRASVSASWVRRTPADFEFSVKLYQKFTHPKMFQERVAAALESGGAADVMRDRRAIVELAKPTAADVDEFRRGIDPLAASGKLGALLAQFPPRFKKTDHGGRYLEALLRAFGDYPVAVELRHRSWSDDLAGTLAILNAHGAAWVQIDEPKFRFSIAQNHLPNVRGFYYMRLHGRNAAEWWSHRNAEDRYNYLYTADELREFSRTLDAARHIVKKAYLYTNNHYSAKAVANAAMIKAQLGEPVAGEYPESFVERYPEVRGIVAPGREVRLKPDATHRDG
jgi:uncharacterized protein YecE (DUF72 family)